VRSPVVSVCVPVAGNACFLADAVRSALAEPVDGLEVLVHDDASSGDGVAAIVRALDDSRVRYLRHRRRLGVAGNRNSLLARARGRYVAWLDADDLCLPGGLARRLAALDALPGASLVHAAPRIIDERGCTLPSWRQPSERDTVESSGAAFRELIQANELTTSTVVVRAAAQRAAGPFVAYGRSSSDWHMWLRLALRGDVAYLAEPVAAYRQHLGSISHATTASGERLRCDMRVAGSVLRSYAALLPGHAELVRAAHAALAAKALLAAGDARTRGRRTTAARAVLLAARLARGRLAGGAPALAASALGADDLTFHVRSRAALRALLPDLGPSRFARSLERMVTTDPAWAATLARVARVVRAKTPPDAVVGSVTKWDPTLLALAGRRGRQVPDRRLLPDGYPADDAFAIDHVEQLRSEGLSHLVFPSASFWWLEHYPRLADLLRSEHTQVHADSDSVIFDLRSAA
jgi:hypothetical protein